MKKGILILIAVLSLFACSYDDLQKYSVKVYEPKFSTYEEFRNSISYEEYNAQQIEGAGTICSYAGYMYVSKPGKGFYIINNKNPEHPEIVGFMNVSGNYDLVIYNNVLYADALIDLVWFDLSNPAVPQLSGRVKDVFSSVFPPVSDEYFYDWKMCFAEENKDALVTGWKLTQRTEILDSSSGGILPDYNPNNYIEIGDYKSTAKAVNGSMSRFALKFNHLYTIDGQSMRVYDLNSLESKQRESAIVSTPPNTERLSYSENKLFLISPGGMNTYLVTNPAQPVNVGETDFINSCNHISVFGDIAYVTSYSGNSCKQAQSKLTLFDVSDTCEEIEAYQMSNPRGIEAYGGKLFVCDEGLKVYQTSNTQPIIHKQLLHLKDIRALDVKMLGNILVVTCTKGLLQYKMEADSRLSLLSTIPVEGSK
ncbi:hypothetical protein LJC06_00755 [Bacteroidales bacterium OttesenSCG-928-I14]|nr:hypothetical protein [Bacteroidales bacterium OttesenSCG-928-I14]